MKKALKWVVIVFAALVVIGVIVDLAKSPAEKAAELAAREAKAAKEKAENQAKEVRELEALPSITAAQLESAYEANTVAADQQFKGKRFKVSGRVTSINTDFTGSPYITMGGHKMFMEPHFAFDKSDSSALASIKKGMQLTLICRGKGDVAKTPMSDDCQILQ